MKRIDIKRLMLSLVIITGTYPYMAGMEDDAEIAEDMPKTPKKPAEPVLKKELAKPIIRLVGINNQTSKKLDIIAGGETFKLAPNKTESFDIQFFLSPTTPVLKIPNAVVRAYKSSGPIRIRLSEETASGDAPTKGDRFLISVPYYQVNQAYGTEWANARIIVEEPSNRDIGKRLPIVLASWDNGGKNMPLEPGKHHNLALNLTIVEKPTSTTNEEGKQVKTTFIDLENDALEVEVEQQ